MGAMKSSLILSCAQVEATEKSGEVIFHFKDAPHPARFGCARLRETKRSALAAVAQHLLGSAAAPHRAGSWSGMESFSVFFGTHLNATSYKNLAGVDRRHLLFDDRIFPLAGDNRRFRHHMHFPHAT